MPSLNWEVEYDKYSYLCGNHPEFPIYSGFHSGRPHYNIPYLVNLLRDKATKFCPLTIPLEIKVNVVRM